MAAAWLPLNSIGRKFRRHLEHKKRQQPKKGRCHCVSFFFSNGSDVSQVRRRLIREYFRGIGFLHRPCCVTLVYHIPETIGEETLNEGEIIYAG